MKIECQIDKIRNSLLSVEKITGKNLTLPVLSSILFIVKGKNLTLRSTNLSLGIEITIPVKVESEGVVAVRGDILNSLFSVVDSNTTVLFELKDNLLFIKTKNNSISLKTIPHEDFPTLPNVVGENIKISSKKLIDGLKSVFYSASVSDIKPEIGSIYIYKEEDSLVFVATDSFRLAEKRIKIKTDGLFNGILIPFKNTSEIIRVFDKINEDVDIIINKNQASFSVDGIYITSRVVDGIFPDYKQILPKNPTTEATLLKQDFMNALKVSNVLSDKFNQITLHIDPKNKTFEIQSKNTDIGENTTNIATALSGESVSVNLNYKYVLDCFQSINTDSLTIELSGVNKPVIIRPIGDNSFLYLIMPMNR